MQCKMDVDDPFVEDPLDRRLMECTCDSIPIAPERGSGCVCSNCGARCRECPGFGFTIPPAKNFGQIISRVRSTIKRQVRVRGVPPGFVRLSITEIFVVVSKLEAETEDHWSRRFVDLGPPIRIFDVPIVRDLRKSDIRVVR